MNKINWNTVKSETKEELTSKDNRWHITKTKSGDGESDFFLTNYQLLLTPNGQGNNYKACFEDFIENCEQYIEKVRKAQQEAREYMNSIQDSADDSEVENGK